MPTPTFAPIPGTPRSSSGFVRAGDYAYWVAGHAGKFHYCESGNFSPEAHRLDLRNGQWEQLAPFPVLAQGFRMAEWDGSVYALGGFVYEGDGEWPVRSTDVVRRYDARADKWDVVGKLSKPHSSNVCGQVGDLVYLFDIQASFLFCPVDTGEKV